MTLSFTQTINGKPNYFIEKFWSGILHRQFEEGEDYEAYINAHIRKFGKEWEGVDWKGMSHERVNPKLHTIREYRTTKTGERAKKQWKAGDKIHPAINNRSKNYFQFAPTIECKSVQEIKIIKNHYPFASLGDPEWTIHAVFVDNNEQPIETVKELATNDGFDSVKDFFDYFSDGDRQLIHWTDLKY